MNPRLRSILVVAGSILTLGALGAWQGVLAEPDNHAAPAKRTAPAKDPHDSHDAGHDAAHDADDAHGQPGEHADDHGEQAHDSHDIKAHPAPKPAKARLSAKPTEPRKPLFADKNSGKDAKPAAETGDDPTADRALELLKEGNQRWANGETKDPNSDSARRELTADKGQKPFVTILTCADSRIPVERVFDRGVGELFTIRVAGNVAATAEVGTIEYAVEHLHTPLLVVMGHTKCGAVAAAASGARLHGAVGELVAGIAPAIDRVRRANPGADEAGIASAGVKENVWQSIFDLYKASEQVRGDARDGKVRVIGAIYDIATGKVEWLGEHPWQSQILDALQPTAKTANAESDSDSH
ncbi:MAG: carbonic anhydrase [Phycisphaerales bacterium]|nr:carbonic anhydrase [Phycisphaerales bacterium]